MKLVPKNFSKGKHTNIVLTRNDLSVKLKAVMARQHIIVYIYYTRNVLLSAQMGERASFVLICIITSRYNEVK